MIHASLTEPLSRLPDFCRRNAIHRLAVFGSATRDDYRADSDIDLLVEFSPEARIGLLRFEQLRTELEGLLHRPVDLVSAQGLNRHIRADILRSAETVYAE